MTTGLIPYFGYRDAGAAIDFLIDAFGFEQGARYDGADGQVMHAELHFGTGTLMAGSLDGAGSGKPAPAGHGVYVVVDDVDAHFARAKAAGADVIWAPHDTEFGTRRHRVRDPEGYEWSFGTYSPGQ